MILVAVTFFYAWQGRQAARAATGSVKAMGEQVALQRDQLRYYYQPSLLLAVHEPTEDALLVKVYPANQVSVFAVQLGWLEQSGDNFNMEVTPGEDADRGLKGLTAYYARPEGEPTSAPAWNSACIAGGSVGWCLFTMQPGGTILTATWKHTGPGRWTQSWELTENKHKTPVEYGLTPQEMPRFAP